jgi:hypothetical protein
MAAGMLSPHASLRMLPQGRTPLALAFTLVAACEIVRLLDPFGRGRAMSA